MAKTSTEKARTLREKRAREGLAEVRGVWAPAQHHKALRERFREAIEAYLKANKQ